jgi:hypothetical protein
MDRLDGMTDRCLKRLLFVRGFKSISSSLATAQSPPPTELIAALNPTSLLLGFVCRPSHAVRSHPHVMQLMIRFI